MAERASAIDPARATDGGSSTGSPGVPVFEPEAPVADAGVRLHGLYETRFDDRRQAGKMAVWAELTRYFGRWVDATKPVIDVG
jgi:hypothetical protein